MAEAGFRFHDRQEIYAELSIAADSFLRRAPLQLGGTLLNDLPDELRQELTDPQERERTIAQADLGCRRDLDQTLHDARVAVEQDIIDNEPERLDRVAVVLAEFDN